MAADTPFPIKKPVNLTADQARLISDSRFAQRLKSENEAIRTLIQRDLDAEPKPAGPKAGNE